MGLTRYAIRRLLQAVPVVLGLLTVTFVLANAIPGNPVEVMLGPSPSLEEVARIEARYGLDRPLAERYVNYLAGVLRGDLGTSLYFEVPVARKIAERLPKTLLLVVASYAFALLTAIPLGIVSATRRNTATDHVARVVSLLGVSTPSFWIALLLVLIFAHGLGWFPATDLVLPWADPATVDGAATSLGVLGQSARHLVLPTVALGTLQMASIARIERAELLSALSADYVTHARAYGVSERRVLTRHAFRNAQLPVITVIGLQLSSAVAGAVLIEVVFAINGMGTLVLTGIYNLDYPLILGTTVVFGTVFVLGTILTDVAYAWLDPRITYGEAG